jgi:hypothetical protein
MSETRVVFSMCYNVRVYWSLTLQDARLHWKKEKIDVFSKCWSWTTCYTLNSEPFTARTHLVSFSMMTADVSCDAEAGVHFIHLPCAFRRYNILYIWTRAHKHTYTYINMTYLFINVNIVYYIYSYRFSHLSFTTEVKDDGLKQN